MVEGASRRTRSRMRFAPSVGFAATSPAALGTQGSPEGVVRAAVLSRVKGRFALRP